MDLYDEFSKLNVTSMSLMNIKIIYYRPDVFEGFIVFIILIEINFIYRKKWPVI